MAVDSIMVQVVKGDELAQAMNQAGWHGGEARAAALLRQGESPSMASAMIGHGLLKLFKGRAAKDLPRTFVLAVTADTVYVHKGRGSGSEDSSDYFVTMWPEELKSWPRDQVSIEMTEKGMNLNCVIHAAGEDIPCGAQADETLEDLVAEMSGQAPAQTA
jgi:hypothetical protein